MKMKNKKQTDRNAKKQHVEQLKANKQRKRDTPNLTRTEGGRCEQKSFLIFTEGKNTEPSYFKQFKLPTAEIEVVGIGRNTHSLIKHILPIIKEKNDARERQKMAIFDEVWCVLDVDPNPNNPQQSTNFRNAIELATQNNIKIAYSNQAFEYWFILHFEDHQGGAMNRNDYHNKINNYLKNDKIYYDKNNKLVTDDFFNKMLEIIDKNKEGKPITRQDKAIERAKKILALHKSNGTTPVNAESSTTVFELVEALQKKDTNR